jgi:hypothetical protein
MNKTDFIEDIPCSVYECDSLQKNDELWTLGDKFYCDEHYESLQVDFEKMALDAMEDLGLPEDEAEKILEDIT